MPYRGTNSKRNVVHDKGRSTIREESRAHYFAEKKEHDHELQTAIKTIGKLYNEGYCYKKTQTRNHHVFITFENDSGSKQSVELEYPENLSQIKAHFEDFGTL
ncbi:hypothetical protein ACR6HW_04800 [Fusibacter sp. JL298sf-3]